MLYPTGILTNVKTGRFHPISFRMAPMPGNADANTTAQRYKSAGHHTEGFDTKEQAVAWMVENAEKGVINVETEYGWDGEGVPAMVEWFTSEQLNQTEAV